MKNFFLVIFSLIFLMTFTSASFNTCGDGTIEGSCSVNKPYFCSLGVLIEKASICGCPGRTTIQEDLCVSPYQNNPKEISLDYVLKGDVKNISFTVYENLSNYLFDLPDSIVYSSNETPQRSDFKLKKIDEEFQRILLIPLVVKIQNLEKSKENQARIAISLVQNIPFESSNETIILGNNSINYSRYPYEVLYDQKGVCSSKSELMVFLLREIGYDVVFFYHEDENHDSVGIKCPFRRGLLDTGYCFVETTGPSILTDDENTYLNGIKLVSYPDIVEVSGGESLGYMHEYGDARILKRIRRKVERTGTVNLFQNFQLKRLREKYGLE